MNTLSIDPKAVLDEVQEAFFANLKKGQDAVLETVGDLGEALGTAVRALPVAPSFVDPLPKPDEIVAAGFAFASKLLDSQRDFATKLLAAVPSK